MQRSIPKTEIFGQPLVRLICLFLALITLILYWPVKNYEFNNYDDAQYLTQNPRVQNGLSRLRPSPGLLPPAMPAIGIR